MGSLEKNGVVAEVQLENVVYSAAQVAERVGVLPPVEEEEPDDNEMLFEGNGSSE